MASTIVKRIFQARDKAVLEKNKGLFTSTQIGEITGSSSEGYLSVNRLKTEIIAESFKDSSKLTKEVVIKETYFIGKKKTHSGYLIYHLVNTAKGWKIYDIVY